MANKLLAASGTMRWRVCLNHTCYESNKLSLKKYIQRDTTSLLFLMKKIKRCPLKILRTMKSLFKENLTSILVWLTLTPRMNKLNKTMTQSLEDLILFSRIKTILMRMQLSLMSKLSMQLKMSKLLSSGQQLR